MTDLGTLLAEAAKSGLLGFTLHKTQDGKWQASTTPDRQSWTVAIDADPVAALLKVLGAPAVSEMKTDNTGAEDIFG